MPIFAADARTQAAPDAQTVEAEVRLAFDRYEQALVSNDIATLNELFWNDPRTIRFGVQESLYGYDAITAFRAARPARDLARVLERVTITALSPDCAVAFAEYRRTGSGRRGKQSQTWVRRAEGWRIAGAHVSLEPATGPA